MKSAPGSTFHVTVTLDRAVAEAAPVARGHELHQPSQRVSLRVLVAEDNLVNQTVAARLLEKRGHVVTVVGDGLAAVAAHANGAFDVILMDVQMPEMDGFAATAAIREHERTTGGRIPIIAMTAHAMRGDEARCLEAGMDTYLSKPIQVDRLLEALEPAETGPALHSSCPSARKMRPSRFAFRISRTVWRTREQRIANRE